jgi:hypothetical protein
MNTADVTAIREALNAHAVRVGHCGLGKPKPEPFGTPLRQEGWQIVMWASIA